MPTILACFGITLLAFLVAGCQTTGDVNRNPALLETDRAAVGRVLDDLHEFASRADEARYFALFAPDAVFLGTDATERWSLQQFRDYAHPIFSQGRGWTYASKQRSIGFGPDGRTAWFDESLVNAKLGECRGSGALVRNDEGHWRIVQYNLTIPVPNDLADEFVRRIREHAGQASAR